MHQNLSEDSDSDLLVVEVGLGAGRILHHQCLRLVAEQQPLWDGEHVQILHNIQHSSIW